jgi:hypothetical protein
MATRARLQKENAQRAAVDHANSMLSYVDDLAQTDFDYLAATTGRPVAASDIPRAGLP